MEPASGCSLGVNRLLQTRPGRPSSLTTLKSFFNSITLFFRPTNPLLTGPAVRQRTGLGDHHSAVYGKRSVSPSTPSMPARTFITLQELAALNSALSLGSTFRPWWGTDSICDAERPSGRTPGNAFFVYQDRDDGTMAAWWATVWCDHRQFNDGVWGPHQMIRIGW